MYVEHVDWNHEAAVAMRAAMTEEMWVVYADRFHERVGVEADTVAYTAVAYAPGHGPVGHAALRWLRGDLELKRMFVARSHRGRGVSVALLEACEAAAARLGAPRIVLQTGDRQPDAVRLYEKSGYSRIPIYPPYETMPYSNCFEKLIT